MKVRESLPHPWCRCARAPRHRQAVIACALVCFAALPVPGEASPAEPGRELSRIIHRFDFDEADNPNPTPKYWIRFPDPDYEDPAFPRYTDAYMDVAVGAQAPPSFYLGTEGRSVAYRYVGPDTRVAPGDYLVTGRIKPDALRHGRAAISAYFLDWRGQPVPNTQRFSPLIDSQEAAGQWVGVGIHLGAAPSEGNSVGVTCWVVQDDVWRPSPAPHRHIFERDTTGGAWFDDISVIGLPRVKLVSDHPGNVVELPGRLRLDATVADEEIAGLSATLSVSDMSGRIVFRRDIEVRTFEDVADEAVTVPIDEPGLYKARLDVFSLGEPIVERTVTFAVLRQSDRREGAVGRDMGVIIREASAEELADDLALTAALGVGMIKAPLWSGHPSRPGFDTQPEALHRMLNEMISSRVEVVGVFVGAPASLMQSAGSYTPSLLNILNEDARGWRNDLRQIVAPYASIFNSWQVGGDHQPLLAQNRELAGALAALRAEMRTMMLAPNLTASVSAANEPPMPPLTANNISVDLPADVHPAFVREQIEPYLHGDYQRVWVSVPDIELGGYRCEAALAEWALRLIELRWANVDAIFVPQPWTQRRVLHDAITEPSPAFIPYRTIVDAISGAQPTVRVDLGSTAEILAFADGDNTTLVMWDSSAPPEGTAHTLQLGAVREAHDLWGRPVPIRRTADGRHELVLRRSPVFACGTQRWLLAFRSGMQLFPEKARPVIEMQKHVLRMTNPRRGPVSLRIRFQPPAGWEVNPGQLDVSIAAGATRDFEIGVRQAQAEPAGMKTVVAVVDMLSQERYRLVVPLHIELGLDDVDVWGYAFTRGDEVVIQHGVTSRADVTLSFRAFAVYPGRSRQYRVINELLPGQTVTSEYRFKNVTNGSGRTVRLGLREVGGPRVHNVEIEVQ